MMSKFGCNQSICALSFFLIIVTVCFSTLTILQYKWTSDLQARYDESQQLIAHLRSICFREKGHGRGKRDLSDILQNIVDEQKDIIIDHCTNSNTTLCLKGDKGDPGDTGDNGTTGEPGPKGESGIQGLKGDTGDQGINGTDGEQGPQGPACAKGASGEKGEMGPPGVDGEPGFHGNNGTDGEDGEKGEPGTRGPNGEPGPAGPKGEPGTNGTKGNDGAKGDRGDDGPLCIEKIDYCAANPCVHGTCTNHDSNYTCSCDDNYTGQNCSETIDFCQLSPCEHGTCVDQSPGYTCVCDENFTGENCSVKSVYSLQPELGSSLVLRCNNSQSPNPTVTWTTPDTGNCVDLAPYMSGDTLSISSLQPSQEGNYTCTSSSGNTSETTTFVIHSTSKDNFLDCDFESDDYCNWVKDEDATAGTWKLISGKTPTRNTGPSYDTTLGEDKDGHYIYIESTEGSLGDERDLISVQLPVTTEESCLQFWYHMYGKDTGTLQVLQVKQQDDCTEQTTTVESFDGAQGNVWHKLETMIPASDYPYRVVIQAIRGNGVEGDTAVDDIVFYYGTCDEPLSEPSEEYITVSTNEELVLNCTMNGTSKAEFTWTKVEKPCNEYTKDASFHIASVNQGNTGTYICEVEAHGKISTKTFHVTVEPANATCSFDDGSVCSWTNINVDNFQWNVITGPTPSDDTGPSHGHGSDAGQYLFIEASSPSEVNDIANLQSAALPASHGQCLTFFYTMYGEHTGTLDVQIEDVCSGNKTTLFTTSGDQGSEWLEGNVVIPASLVPRDYKINIVASVGPGYLGDTAIDDVTVTACTAEHCKPNPCEHGKCVNGELNYVCECDQGYTGINCSSQIDHCASNPCVHGACTSHLTNYTCVCDSGFVGMTCEGTDYCASDPSPCSNGATCTNTQSSFSCECTSGFTGKHCIAADYCASNPCSNGATCTNTQTEFQCTCASGYRGKHCIAIDYCASVPCSNGATCTSTPTDFICECTTGYTGTHCTATDYCASNPCSNGATCTNTETNFSCECTVGFIGKHCIRTDFCSSSPCSNGANCTNTVDSFTCDCISGYMGDRCMETDYCASSPCSNGASCTNTPTDFSCECASGYIGKACEGIDYCASGPCSNGATCTNTETEFSCECAVGFIGKHCIRTDYCSSNPCSNGANCTNTVDSFSCECISGFMGDRCMEIDYCASNPCSNGATCTNIDADFSCECATGFIGKHCIRTDYCASSPCSNGATCTNTDTDFSCKCTSGFLGKHCIKIDYCASSQCSNGGICTNTDTDFSCECTSGYMGKQCAARDYCAQSPCSNGGTCTNEETSFNCECTSEYRGIRCQTRDYCASSPCSNGGTCTNTPIGFRCECGSVYIGDRCQDTDYCSSNPCLHGTCTNQQTQYTCACEDGYTGKDCRDTDFCASSPCTHGTCTNEESTYSCACDTGYIGDNCDVDAATQFNLDCSFSDRDLCGWTQSTSDKFDWAIQQGETETANTGPTEDHTDGNGWYLYTESSSPQDPGDVTDLISPTIPSGQEYCFNFYTNQHAYSDYMSTIEVLIQVTSTSETQLATYHNVTVESLWVERSISIPTQNEEFTLIIRGVIGSGVLGDAAIDDTSLQSGSC